jgi:hypothetical protein
MAFNSNEWKPTKPQSVFASLPWTIKEAFFGGGAGGGKSDLLLVLPLLLQLHKNPRFKQLFTRRTYKELKLEIVPRSRDIYQRFGATFNQSDMAWTFPREEQYGSGARNSGAMIFFGHCEHENDVHNYDSMEINLFSPDELTSFTEYMYVYIGFTRVRTSDPSLPAIIRGAGMPGGIGHTFVKKRFVDPAPDGNTIIIGKAGVKRFYVHATLLDNPHIDPAYKQSIDALPESERRAKLGDWDAFLGQVFDEFRDKRYPDEPENAIHVIDEFEIPAWWPRIVIGDWGFAAMTWIGFVAISPSGKVYIYRELYWIKTYIEDWAPIAKDFIDKENIKFIKFCKSAGQDRGQEHTIQQQISSALGRDILLTSNSPGSRVSGKMLIHEYLRWKPKPIIPQSEIPVYNEAYAMQLFRIKGQKAYDDYQDLFKLHEPEVNIPKLQIFKCCTVLIDAIKACSHDKKKVEDIAEFDGDDPIDGLRYIVDAAESYVSTATKEMEKIQKQEHVLQLLGNTQDYTSFYRNMRGIESKSPMKVVSRYHRIRS